MANRRTNLRNDLVPVLSTLLSCKLDIHMSVTWVYAEVNANASLLGML